MVTELALPGVAYAEANWGRWVARCPRPWCTNAMQLEAGQAVFSCLGVGSCGYRTDIVWPPDPLMIETILGMRPVPRTRNWVWGESLEDLMAENAAHDCLPPALLAAAQSDPVLLRTSGDRAVGGLLHRQLEAAGRREIGV